MLTKIEVQTARGSILEMLLGGDEAHSEIFQLRDVDGLGPVDAQISTTSRGTYDGEGYTGSSVGKRNIIFKIGLNPNWVDQSISSLRSLLYTYLMPKRQVTLRFFSDHLPTVAISGYVETVEPNIFSKDPEMQVSILCPEPDFVAIAPTVVVGVVGDGPALAPDLDDYVVANYVGTSPTGFTMVISPSAAVPEFLNGIMSISNVIVSTGLNYSETFSFDGYADSVSNTEFGSVPGQKYIRYRQAGVVHSLLDTVYSGEKWPMLIPGENRISVTAEHETTGNPAEGLNWSLEYFARFGGL